jgi:hypothetical protein
MRTAVPNHPVRAVWVMAMDVTSTEPDPSVCAEVHHHRRHLTTTAATMEAEVVVTSSVTVRFTIHWPTRTPYDNNRTAPTAAIKNN